MDRIEEARDALIDGLQFDPEDKVCFSLDRIRLRADQAGTEHLP
jgi:hypothetical protein